MNELTDEVVSLSTEEAAVLVYYPPLSAEPTIDASARLGTETPRRVDVRFGRLPPNGTFDSDAILVAPTEQESYGDALVYTVAAPDNLTEYGVALTEILEDHDEPLYIRIDSLTALLQHVSLNDAFRFIHVLSSRVARENAVLEARIDPGAHDSQTLATMTQPFDVAIVGEEGNQRVRRRG